VLSLAPSKCLALSALVVPSEPRPHPLSVEPLPVQAEEEPAQAAVEASGTPPRPVPSATMEVGQMAVGATAPESALEPPAEAGPSGGMWWWSWTRTRPLPHRRRVMMS
jgi:hypothetical protein